MKRTKIFIIFLLATITATGYGQILRAEDQTLLEAYKNRLFPDSKNGVFITADYTTDESGRIENWMSCMHSWVMDIVSTDDEIAPVVARTIYMDCAEIIFEAGLRVENWMNTPFEAGLAEEEMSVDRWMSAPFEAGLEEETSVEGWMSAPFEAGMEKEELVVEEWMTSPFKPGLAEEEPAVERWMTASWK